MNATTNRETDLSKQIADLRAKVAEIEGSAQAHEEAATAAEARLTALAEDFSRPVAEVLNGRRTLEAEIDEHRASGRLLHRRATAFAAEHKLAALEDEHRQLVEARAVSEQRARVEKRLKEIAAEVEARSQWLVDATCGIPATEGRLVQLEEEASALSRMYGLNNPIFRALMTANAAAADRLHIHRHNLIDLLPTITPKGDK